MANEFIARKGLIVLTNGATITGSLKTQGNINSIGYEVTASKFSGSFYGDGSGITGIASTLIFSGSTGNDVLNLKTDALNILGSNGITTTVTDNTVTINLPAGTVTASSQVDVRNTTGIATIATTGSNTFIGNQTVFGDIFLSGSNRLVYNNNSSGSLLFGFFDGSTITGPYYQIFGNNYANVAQRGTAEFVYDTRNGGDANFHISSFDGSNWVQRFRVDNGGAEVTGSLEVTTSVTASGFKGDGSQLTNVAASAVEFANILNKPTLVSASSQIDVRNTTGIATIATTGSNTFTGVQTISNTTNSTTFTDGALIVQGGVGIAKDVNISGSLKVTGLLTAVSMSTQYVTSSQYVVGDNRIILNSDDLARFGGVSVIDSGSTYGTGSLLWDSLNNRWIYQADDQAYNSAIIIAGPQNTGTLGDEVGLTAGRVPVASGDDHIDSRPASSSIRVDFPSRLTHVEAGLVITGSVTSSVGFSGDGSQLTGIVTNLNVSGSDGGTGTVSLKTQSLTVSGSNGIVATAAGQTITLSGSNATTTAKGVASFTSSNFTVTGGEVSAKAITFNSVPLNLGSAYSFGIQNITSQGATTADQLTLNGGAIIHGVLYTSGSNIDVDTGTEVVAAVSTGSYDAAFFDYVIKKGSNYRAGTVTAVWEAGTSNIEFTDVSTNDLGNTADVILSVDLLSATARLKATVSSDNWIVKTSVRAL